MPTWIVPIMLAMISIMVTIVGFLISKMIKSFESKQEDLAVGQRTLTTTVEDKFVKLSASFESRIEEIKERIQELSKEKVDLQRETNDKFYKMTERIHDIELQMREAASKTELREALKAVSSAIEVLNRDVHEMKIQNRINEEE